MAKVDSSSSGETVSGSDEVKSDFLGVVIISTIILFLIIFVWGILKKRGFFSKTFSASWRDYLYIV